MPVGEELLVRYGAQSHYDRDTILVTHLFHPQTVRTCSREGPGRGRRVSLLDLEWPEVDRWGWEAALDAAREIDVICTNAQLLAARFGDASLDLGPQLRLELAAGRRAACVTLGAEGVVICAEDGSSIIRRCG